MQFEYSMASKQQGDLRQAEESLVTTYNSNQLDLTGVDFLDKGEWSLCGQEE